MSSIGGTKRINAILATYKDKTPFKKAKDISWSDSCLITFCLMNTPAKAKVFFNTIDKPRITIIPKELLLKACAILDMSQKNIALFFAERLIRCIGILMDIIKTFIIDGDKVKAIRLYDDTYRYVVYLNSSPLCVPVFDDTHVVVKLSLLIKSVEARSRIC